MRVFLASHLKHTLGSTHQRTGLFAKDPELPLGSSAARKAPTHHGPAQSHPLGLVIVKSGFETQIDNSQRGVYVYDYQNF